MTTLIYICIFLISGDRCYSVPRAAPFCSVHHTGARPVPRAWQPRVRAPSPGRSIAGGLRAQPPGCAPLSVAFTPEHTAPRRLWGLALTLSRWLGGGGPSGAALLFLTPLWWGCRLPDRRRHCLADEGVGSESSPVGSRPGHPPPPGLSAGVARKSSRAHGGWGGDGMARPRGMPVATEHFTLGAGDSDVRAPCLPLRCTFL